MFFNVKQLTSLLEVFSKVAKISEKFSTIDNIIWTSIIFDTKSQTISYKGWRFKLEVPFPVEESFTVSYQALFNSIKLSSSEEIELEVQKNFLLIKDKGVRQKLKLYNLDAEPLLQEEEENIHSSFTIPPSFLEGISLCTLASSSVKTDPFRYGVVITNKEHMYASDNMSIGFYTLEKPLLDNTVLIQLHWCDVLLSLPNAKFAYLSLNNESDKFATFHIEFDNHLANCGDIKLTFPVLRIEGQDIIVEYVRSLTKHVNLPLFDIDILKRLEVTTDTAYKYVSLFSKNDSLFLKTTSSIKGSTIIRLCSGNIPNPINIPIQNLRKAIKLEGSIYIDFDNQACFSETENFTYSFSLLGG